MAYIDQANLSIDATFLKRITMAIAHFANYIIGEAHSVANHQQRYRWALNAVLNPGSIAQPIALEVADDQRVEIPERRRVSGDDELLSLIDAHFLPSTRAQARLILAIAALCHEAFQPLCLYRTNQVRQACLKHR